MYLFRYFTALILHIDIDSFKADLRSSVLCSGEDKDISLDEAVKNYNETLTELMDKHCPVIVKKVKMNKAPWMDAELRDLRRMRRRAERAHNKRNSSESHRKYRDLCKKFSVDEFKKRCHYVKASLKSSSGDIKMLYKKLNRLLGKPDSNLPDYCDGTSLANEFGQFFDNKVIQIRDEINASPSTSSSSASSPDLNIDTGLSQFNPVSLEETIGCIKNMSNKFCAFEPLPTFLLKECVDELAPSVCNIINQSIIQNEFPCMLKKAIIKPTLKDENIDPDILRNYRPVSNLPVLSKILEKVVLDQLNTYLEHNELHCPVQSGYRANHSCETLLTRMNDDVLKEINQGDLVILLLLDLSAAFDTIDHEILTQRLLDEFGISGSALDWMKDYLVGRSFFVKIDQKLSDAFCLLFGVPQGSLLGPILFILYIKTLEAIARKYGLRIHLYADDSQLFISLSPADTDEWIASKQAVEACLLEIREWMTSNFMKVNEKKTQLLLIGKKASLNSMSISVELNFGEVILLPTECKKDTWISLGIKLDENFNMDRQINSVKQKCNWTLMNLRRISFYLDQDTKIMLVKQLVVSKLDYCNSLYMNLAKCRLRKLSSVLNSCIRYIYNIDDTSLYLIPYYSKSHILPMDMRIKFKVCLLVFKILNGQAPEYLCELVERDSLEGCKNTRLRPDHDSFRLKVPKLPSSKIDNRRFSNYAPETWNSLPLTIRSSNDVSLFKKLLKTHYFDTLLAVSAPGC